MFHISQTLIISLWYKGLLLFVDLESPKSRFRIHDGTVNEFLKFVVKVNYGFFYNSEIRYAIGLLDYFS